MKRKKIIIDITNAVPGKGGSGGGIVTYTINLILNLDNITNNKFEIICLKNSKFLNFPKLQNITILNCNVNNSNLVSRLFWLYIRLPFFCFSQKPDVVHRIISEIPFFQNSKYVITLHDFMFDLYLKNKELKSYLTKKEVIKYRFLNFLNRVALMKSKKIVVLSDTLKNEIERKFPNLGEKIIVTKMASTFLVKECPQDYTPIDITRIGFIAGLLPHKGHLRALHLAKCFLELNFRNFKIYFRGSQVNHQFIQHINEKIKELNLQNFVYFESYEPLATIEQIYSHYDIIALFSDYEGFGLPILEAQAHCKVVICSDIPIFRELVNGSAIFLNLDFTILDVKNIISQLQNKSILNTFMLEGKRNVEEYSWSKMAYQTLQLYQTL